MPQELLSFPPSYLFVGIYRLVSDAHLWRPIWHELRASLRTALLAGAIFSGVSFPVTRLWVGFFARQGALARYAAEASFLRVPLATFATLGLVAAQASWLVEWLLKRKLRRARAQAYEMTVRSRAKDDAFWGPYVEEWEHPPLAKAHRTLEKARWHAALSGPLVRLFVLRVLLLPLHFVPFLNTIVSAFLASLSLAEHLLKPYFERKNMSALQRALFVAEREAELRWLGFWAACLEKTPLLGMVLSISNRIAFAMYAHDLEKRQHLIRDGRLQRRKEPYLSKTEAVELDLPKEAIGNFPKKYHPEDNDSDKKFN